MSTWGLRAPSYWCTRRGRKAGQIVGRAARPCRVPGSGAHHPAGWISGNCKSDHHGNCTSLKCECPCHEREAE